MENKMTQRELGYLEGIIDGEGCLSLSKYVSQYKTYTYVPQLTIANTDKFLIKKMKKLIKEGTIKSYQPKYPNSKLVYQYRLSPNGLRRLLPSVKLIAKEKERKLMIKALRILKKRQYGFGKWNPNYLKKELDDIYKRLRKRHGRK